MNELLMTELFKHLENFDLAGFRKTYSSSEIEWKKKNWPQWFEMFEKSATLTDSSLSTLHSTTNHEKWKQFGTSQSLREHLQWLENRRKQFEGQKGNDPNLKMFSNILNCIFFWQPEQSWQWSEKDCVKALNDEIEKNLGLLAECQQYFNPGAKEPQTEKAQELLEIRFKGSNWPRWNSIWPSQQWETDDAWPTHLTGDQHQCWSYWVQDLQQPGGIVKKQQLLKRVHDLSTPPENADVRQFWIKNLAHYFKEIIRFSVTFHLCDTPLICDACGRPAENNATTRQTKFSGRSCKKEKILDFLKLKQEQQIAKAADAAQIMNYFPNAFILLPLEVQRNSEVVRNMLDASLAQRDGSAIQLVQPNENSSSVEPLGTNWSNDPLLVLYAYKQAKEEALKYADKSTQFLHQLFLACVKMVNHDKEKLNLVKKIFHEIVQPRTSNQNLLNDEAMVERLKEKDKNLAVSIIQAMTTSYRLIAWLDTTQKTNECEYVKELSVSYMQRLHALHAQ